MANFYRPGKQPRATMKPGDILINTSTFQPAHCGIVIANGGVIHATNKGIVEGDIEMWGSEADIFRPKPEMSVAEAAAVCNVAKEIMASATYGLGRAMFKSTFASGSVGTGLRGRLAKYRERLKNDQGFVKHVYCSELTILCYQLAWIDHDAVNEGHRLFIALDGKHTWPSTLRRYLKANVNWSFLGQYTPA